MLSRNPVALAHCYSIGCSVDGGHPGFKGCTTLRSVEQWWELKLGARLPGFTAQPPHVMICGFVFASPSLSFLINKMGNSDTSSKSVGSIK